MSWLPPQNLSIYLRSVSQPALPMQCQTVLERGFRRC